jgi:hypothetical protein
MPVGRLLMFLQAQRKAMQQHAANNMSVTHLKVYQVRF